MIGRKKKMKSYEMTRTNRKQWEEKMKQRMSAYQEQMAFLVKEEKKAQGGTKA